MSSLYTVVYKLINSQPDQIKGSCANICESLTGKFYAK